MNFSGFESAHGWMDVRRGEMCGRLASRGEVCGRAGVDARDFLGVLEMRL